jgi:hypothetical protein
MDRMQEDQASPRSSIVWRIGFHPRKAGASRAGVAETRRPPDGNPRIQDLMFARGNTMFNWLRRIHAGDPALVLLAGLRPRRAFATRRNTARGENVLSRLLTRLTGPRNTMPSPRHQPPSREHSPPLFASEQHIRTAGFPEHASP